MSISYHYCISTYIIPCRYRALGQQISFLNGLLSLPSVYLNPVGSNFTHKCVIVNAVNFRLKQNISLKGIVIKLTPRKIDITFTRTQ